MNDTKAKESFTRFVPPIVLALLGISLLQLDLSLMGLTVREITTIGFGAFAVGAFSFIMVFNHARNPMATDNVIVNASQALVVYAGLLTILVYEGVLATTTLVISVCFVLVLGTSVGLIFERLNSDTQS